MNLTLLLPPFFAGIAIHLSAARTNNGAGGIKPCDQAGGWVDSSWFWFVYRMLL